MGLKIGGHYFGVFNLKDLKKIVKHVKESGATAFQIFNGDKDKTTLKYKAQFSSADYKAARHLLKNLTLVVHANLTLNLGNPITTSHRYRWMLDNLNSDMQFATKLGAVGCVIHTGFMTHTPTEAEAIRNMVDNIVAVLESQPSATKTQLLIETSAGQRNRIATSIEELRDLYMLIPAKFRERVGFCIDSCHIFSAGYPINTVEGIDNYFAKWEAEIGVDKLRVVHLNDSQKEFGSHVNRHENLLKGYIFTKETLAEFLKFVKDKVLILETRDPKKYAREITLVRKIVEKI